MECHCGAPDCIERCVWLWKSLPALTRIARNLNSFTGWVTGSWAFHKNAGDVQQLECVAVNQRQAGLSAERPRLCLRCHHLCEGHPVSLFFFYTVLHLTFREMTQWNDTFSRWRGNTCVLYINGCNFLHLMQLSNGRLTRSHLPAREQGRFLTAPQLCYYLFVLRSSKG